MLKKIAKLACLSVFVLSGTLSADQQTQGYGTGTPSKQGPEIYDGGFTMGASLNTAFSTEPFLTLGYINDFFLFDVGFNFTNYQHPNYSSNKNYADFMGHLGLRAQIFQNLYFTYGVAGGVAAGDFNGNNNRPWNVGAFGGLDLQITRHFLLSAKINAYNYEHVANNHNRNEVFSSSSFNFAYVF